MVFDSQTSPKLPVIDFTGTDLKMGTSLWVSTCKDVRQALEEYGCFEVVYDKVTPQLHDAIFHSMKDLFDLPVDTKRRYAFDLPLYGYRAPSSISTVCESLSIKDVIVFEETQSLTNLMWPSGNEHFRETVNSYSKMISELEQMVTRMIFESFNVGKYYEPHIKSLTNVLKLNKYKEPETNETNVGLAPHVDQGFVTILGQNQVNGLEVQRKDGSWMPMSPSTNSSFFVMLGRAFMVWSNGRMHAPTHRVMMSGNKERYSLGLFTYSTGIVQPAEELIDEEHPAKFEPFDNIEWVRSIFLKYSTKASSQPK